MSKPEWVQLAQGVRWCKGCGCVKLTKLDGSAARYKVPRRETERRKAKEYHTRQTDVCTCLPDPWCVVHG